MGYSDQEVFHQIHVILGTYFKLYNKISFQKRIKIFRREEKFVSISDTHIFRKVKEEGAHFYKWGMYIYMYNKENGRTGQRIDKEKEGQSFFSIAHSR